MRNMLRFCKIVYDALTGNTLLGYQRLLSAALRAAGRPSAALQPHTPHNQSAMIPTPVHHQGPRLRRQEPTPRPPFCRARTSWAPRAPAASSAVPLLIGTRPGVVRDRRRHRRPRTVRRRLIVRAHRRLARSASGPPGHLPSACPAVTAPAARRPASARPSRRRELPGLRMTHWIRLGHSLRSRHDVLSTVKLRPPDSLCCRSHSVARRIQRPAQRVIDRPVRRRP